MIVERSRRPTFVGDVRCATTGWGSSWKLSGGRALSSLPAKASKNLQVLPRDRAQELRVGFRQGLLLLVAGRKARPAGHGRRSGPEREEDAGFGEGARLEDRHQDRARGREEQGGAHAPIEAGERQVQVTARLARRHPFEQPPPREDRAGRASSRRRRPSATPGGRATRSAGPPGRRRAPGPRRAAADSSSWRSRGVSGPAIPRRRRRARGSGSSPRRRPSRCRASRRGASSWQEASPGRPAGRGCAGGCRSSSSVRCPKWRS